jgi:transketolase
MNEDAKLNQNLFEAERESAPIRKGFGEGLLEAGRTDDRVVALCADLTESTQMHLFRDAFPERFVQVGVAEQNLVSVASGMAAMGKTPFCSSYAMFSPGRSWEQIRTTVAYNDQPVVIVGSHAGVSVGPDGGTHQAIEDIALTRIIPRMVVVSPCDAIEARKATLALAALRRPSYLRLAREATPVITTDETPFEIGKAQVFWEPEDGVAPQVGIVATGALVAKAMEAAKMLEEESGVAATVLNVATIKPLDRDAILALAESAGCLVTVEEHQTAGGLGSAVAELLAATRPTPIEFVGVPDRFGQSGKPEELVEYYGMGAGAIVEACQRAVARK